MSAWSELFSPRRRLNWGWDCPGESGDLPATRFVRATYAGDPCRRRLNELRPARYAGHKRQLEARYDDALHNRRSYAATIPDPRTRAPANDLGWPDPGISARFGPA